MNAVVSGTLWHRPLGDEHPYTSARNERTPRYPLAGQAVTLGIEVPAEINAVTVLWELNGIAQPARRAAQIEPGIWQAELPGQPSGAEVRYFFEAGGKREGPYTYNVTAWELQAGWGIAWRESKPGVWEGFLSKHATASGVPLKIIAVERLNGDAAPLRRVRVTFDCPADEAFYGFGERFNALNQRGQQLDVRCYEEYKNQGKRTYIPMPFFVSSRGYGLFINTRRYVAYDLAASAPNQWSFEAEVGPDGMLPLVLFTAPDLFAITGMFSEYVGKATLPPAWAFGPWMSGNEWNSQARVMEEVGQTLQHQIPATVLVIEAWSDETTFYIWNDAQYTPRSGQDRFRYQDFTFPAEGKWPNPKAMVDYLHEQGIRLVLWQVPAFKNVEPPPPQHAADEAYMLAQGYMVREADGSPYRIRPFWFRGGLVWDVTNPAARDWWLSKRQYLLEDLGIDGFKTDGGEHLWGYGLRFGDGRTSDELWNEYPLLYTGAYYAFARKYRREALTFSRAGFTGAQQFPVHWAGDENSTWDAFRHSILAGLSAGISGIPFWGWDIGGFSGEIPDAELYMRATAMAAFCPIMQYHAEYNDHRLPRRDRTPWNIVERTGHPKVLSTYRFFANLRMNLMPYLIQEAKYCVESGQPMMRALAAVYPSDANCANYPYQYLFGRDLLVCPVTLAGSTTLDVYLPQGVWYDLWSGEAVADGTTIQRSVPEDVIPVYVRKGARLPLYLPEGATLGTYTGNEVVDTPNKVFIADGTVGKLA